MILRLAISSLIARALTVGMTILAIALSVALFLGVEKIRTGAKASFADTISGTDLIVGARSGSVQLLLYSVFRIGNATNNLTWESYHDIAKQAVIPWPSANAAPDSAVIATAVVASSFFMKSSQTLSDQSVKFSTNMRNCPYED
jgi:putative ABC transport system permease protein